MLLELIAAASRQLPAFRGKAQMARQLMRCRREPSGSAWLLTRHNGDRIVLPPDSNMCWQTAFTGVWDDPIIDHIGRFVRPGTLVLDIGAAIGLWTIPLARVARMVGATVVAVEPMPANARWLHANLALNDMLDEVVVHPVALGSSTGVARLESSEMAGGSGAIALSNGAPLAVDGVDVVVRRLDDLPLTAPVSFMKLDVEGLECQVLDGATSVIQTDRPVILGEFSTEFLELRGETLTPLLERFADLRYRIVAVDVDRTRPWRARDRVLLRVVPAGAGHAPSGDLLLIPEH